MAGVSPASDQTLLPEPSTAGATPEGDLMSCDRSHGTDVVAIPRNAATPWAGTHGAGCVTCCFDGLVLTGPTVGQRHPFRCMDGIDILQQRP